MGKKCLFSMFIIYSHHPNSAYDYRLGYNLHLMYVSSSDDDHPFLLIVSQLGFLDTQVIRNFYQFLLKTLIIYLNDLRFFLSLPSCQLKMPEAEIILLACGNPMPPAPTWTTCTFFISHSSIDYIILYLIF